MVLSLFGRGSNPYLEPTGWGTFTEGAPGVKEAFAVVEKRVLKHMGASTWSVRDFKIQVRSQTATFTDPSTKAIIEVDLPAIQDPRIQSALKQYYDARPGARKNMSYAQVAPNCKGDLGGKKALVRTTKALENLRTDFDFETHIPTILATKSKAKQRLRYSRRFIFADAFLTKWKETIAEKFNEKQDQLKDPSLPDAQANQLRKELGELRRLNEKLKEIDLYALSKALELIPEERVNPVTLDNLVGDIEKAVLEDIKPKKFLGLSKANPSEADKLYARQVAGMAVRGRKAFFAHCKRVFGYRLQESVADVFLRETLIFATMDPDSAYEAEGFKNSILLQGMSPELSKEMLDILEGIGLKVSSSCKEEMPWSDYIDPTVSMWSTPEERAAAKHKRMQETLAAHRKGVQDKMAGDLPKPLVSAPGLGGVARTGLGLAAAGTAAASLAHYMGVPIPASIRSVTNYLGPVAGGTALAHSVFHRAYNYCCPLENDPVTRTKRRKWKFNRVLLLGGASVLAGYVGQMAYAAATPFLAAMEPATTCAAAPNMLMPAAQPMSGLEPPIVPGLLAQAGIFGTLAVQTAGQAADYVSKSSFIPMRLGSWNIPIPTFTLLELGGRVSRHIPIIGNDVADFVFLPLRSANVLGMIAPAAQAAGQIVSARLGLPQMLNAFREGFSADGCPSYSTNPFDQMGTPERLACKAVLAWGQFQNWVQDGVSGFFGGQPGFYP